MDDFPVIKLNSVNSTNTYLKNLIKKDKFVRCAVYSISQTQGRGRGENKWISPKGGAYISIAFPVENHENLKFVGPYITFKVIQWLKDKFNISAQIKWPNDILVNEKKLAGFLIELISLKNIGFVPIIGLGLNVNVTPEINEQYSFKAVSIFDLTEKQHNIDDIIDDLVQIIRSAENIKSSDTKNLLKNIKTFSATLGKTVKIFTTNSQSIIGKAIDIDENFQLKVEHNGIIENVDAGDCYHVRDLTNQGE